MTDTLREKLADYAHKAWSGWMKYLFQKSTVNVDGTVTIPNELADRWIRQMHTPYERLPEEEKNSDRIEADNILGLVDNVSGDKIWLFAAELHMPRLVDRSLAIANEVPGGTESKQGAAWYRVHKAAKRFKTLIESALIEDINAELARKVRKN